MFSRISVDEPCLIPCRRNFAQEVQTDFRSIFQIVRRQREILDRILEEHACSYLEYVCRASDGSALIILAEPFVHEASSEFHAADTVADERVQTGSLCFLIALILREYKVFRSSDSFASDIVRIHSLPSSRQCTSVEYDHQAVVIRIAEDGLIMSHGLLLVSSEEIYLDALDSKTLHPAHLLLACNRIGHYVYRALLDVVPPSA